MIKSFLMIGQSNMAGRGHLGEVAPISDPRLLMMRNCRWQLLSEPVNFDRPTAGVCLATSFAYRFIQEHPEDSAAMIPCADGGTGIDDWARGTPLFEHAVFCARQAMKISEFSGVLWHQGEHDSCAELESGYTEKFLQFREALFSELKVDVPMLIGGVPLAEFSDDSEKRFYADRINEQLQHISKTVPGVFYVSSKGLLCNEDRLHICAASLREFGDRYYRVFSQKESLYD